MKNTFKGFSLVFVAMFLVFSVRGHSDAGINEVGQSLKKDTVSLKTTNEVQIRNKAAASKSGIKAIKQPDPKISKTKAKSTEFKTTINEIFKKSKTAKDLFFQKFIYKYLKNPPSIKIDKASQPFKTLDTQFKKNPTSMTSAQKPLKIDQKTPVSWIKPITDFPGFEADPNDTLEIEGVQDVNDIYNNSDYFITGTYPEVLTKLFTLESMLPSFCEKYSKYPHICAMLKFYYAEIRTCVFSAPRDGVYYDGYKFQELYTQIDETYSKETGSKEELFKKLSNVCKERISYIASDINTGIGQKISENEAEIEMCLNIIKKLKENNNIVEVVYKANGEGINFYRIGDLKIASFGTGFYDHVLFTYSQIIKDYCAMRKFDEAGTALNALNTFYSSEYPAKFTSNLIAINANGEEYQAGTDKYTVKRDTTTYTDLLKKYMDWNSQYGEIAENGEAFQNKVAEIINDVSSYQFDESKDNISLQELDNIKTKFPNKSDEGNDGYYSKKSIITSLYFTKTENIELPMDEVVNPLMTFCLRAKTDSNNNAPVYTVAVKANSVKSKRERIINLKRDWLLGGYCTAFQLNMNDNPKNIMNLINNANDETGLKHSICIADGILKYLEDNWAPNEGPNPFKTIINSNFFKNFMGQGIVDIKHEKFSLDRMPITTNFLNSMGFEAIEMTLTNSGVVPKILFCQNQADWFIAQVHGVEGYNSSISLDTGNSDINWLLDTWNLNNLNITISKLKFIILSSCGVLKVNYVYKSDGSIEFALKSSSGIVCRKKFGNKTALLGYSNDINGYVSSELLNKLILYLNTFNPDNVIYPYTEAFQEIIITQWIDINKKNYEDSLTKLKPYISQDGLIRHTIVYPFDRYKYAKAACAILNTQYYEIISKTDAIKKKHKTQTDQLTINKVNLSSVLND